MSEPTLLANPRTICVRCKHFLDISGGFNAGVWYNHLCKATPLPVAIDPVDGRTKAYGVNAVGTRYWVGKEEAYAFCRDINTGDCPKYEGEV